MRRLLTSWVALTLTLVALCVGAGLTLSQFQRQVEDRAQRAAVETAEIVVALVVHRHVGEGDFQRGSLTPAERAGMDADISFLLGQGRLVGLEVWRTDGLLIYADHQHPTTETRLPADELMRSQKGKAWVEVSPKAERGVVTVDVFLPYEAGNDGVSDGWVEVLLPQNVIAADVRRSTRQLDGAAALLVVVTIGALLLLRRRLLARERDASHDGLTGLLNRGALREQIRRASPAHQRKSFCVKRLVGASSVVCPCIAVMGLVPAACNRVERRRAGLPMMSVEITDGCLNAAWGSPRPPA